MYRDIKKSISIISLALVCGYGIISYLSGNPPLISLSSNSNTTENVASPVLAQNVATTTQSNIPDTYPVVRVVDGDTIIVHIGGTDQNIRLIGVNTPETLDPRKPVQCFGKEASTFLKTMLAGKSVRLVTDPTQTDRDKYGRLLRYVYLDNTLINEKIIQSGYGFEYTYRIPYEYQKQFKESQVFAQSGGLGLWATSTCNGLLK